MLQLFLYYKKTRTYGVVVWANLNLHSHIDIFQMEFHGNLWNTRLVPKNMEFSFVPDSIYIPIGCLMIPNTIKYFLFIAGFIGLRPHTTWGFLFDTPTTQIHDHSLSWLDTGTSIKDGGIKLDFACLKITEI